MSGVFYISDLHLGGHTKIVELRGFDTVEEHDEAVLDTIRALPVGAQLWIVGDISSGKPEEEIRALQLLGDVFAEYGIRAHLIFGNHERGHPMHRSAYKFFDLYDAVFESVHSWAERRMGGVRVLIHHHPYNGDSGSRTEDRHVQYRMRDMGMPIIHGHVHKEYKVTLSAEGSIQIHIGFDAWRRPVSFEEVQDLLVQAKNPNTELDVLDPAEQVSTSW